MDRTSFLAKGHGLRRLRERLSPIRYYPAHLSSAPGRVGRAAPSRATGKRIIKNAVKHGNGCDPCAKWICYRFTQNDARLIVGMRAGGFLDIEKWNLFNRKRQEYLDREDYTALMSCPGEPGRATPTTAETRSLPRSSTGTTVSLSRRKTQ